MKDIKYPEIYKKQILESLKKFPELHNENISFIFTKSKLPYYSRPNLFSLINPLSKRKYIIGISTKSTKIREKTLMSNLSYNAQVGAFSHELAHISFYKTKSFSRLIKIGFLYLTDFKFKAHFERMTDEIAIKHGLGSKLYQWSKEVYPTKRKDGNRYKIYYSPKEINKLNKKTIANTVYN